MRTNNRGARSALVFALAGGGLATLACAGSAYGQRFATGLVPLDHAVYVKLPSVKRHRGFYKPVVDLTDRFPQPGYQGQQGACVAWATTYAARSFLISGQMGRPPQAATELPSPEYIYSRGHGEAGDCRTGISMVQALDILKDEGVVPLSDYPVDAKNCLHPPPEALKGKAALLKIGGWRAIQRKDPDDWRTPIVLDDVKAQLSQGLPVVFSMQVSAAFMALKANSGVFHADAPDGGWHAMALVGYDENRQALRVMNSWGRDWGDGGYAWIDYATFQTLAGEAYVMQPPIQQRPTPPSPPPAPPSAGVDAQIGQILSTTDCSALQLSQEGGHRLVQGFAGLSPDLARTRDSVMALDPALQWRVAVHPWPQCEAELTLAGRIQEARVELQISDASGRPMLGDPVVLHEGEDFAITVETRPDKPYVHVVYIQADGSAVELYRGAPLADADGRRRVVVGADGPHGLRFRVDQPFGNESLIAVASAGPLFGPELRTQVTEREFLTLLRAKLVTASHAGHPVSAAVVRMQSSAADQVKTAFVRPR